MVVALLEKLQKEWHVIKATPFSFAIICAVAIGTIYGGCRLYFTERIKDAETRAENWKGDVDYWKDKANQPHECPAAPSTEQPNPQAPPRPKAEAVKKGGQTATLNCDGGNCATSVGQQGGITAGQIVVGEVTRRLTKKEIQEIAAFLQTAKVKATISISVAQGDAQSLADDVYEAFNEGGWPLRENSVNTMIAPLTPDAHKFGSIEIYSKGEPRDGPITVENTDPVFYVAEAMGALKIPMKLIRNQSHGDDIDVKIFSLPH